MEHLPFRKDRMIRTAAFIAILLSTVSPSAAQDRQNTAAGAAPCPAGNSGITLPADFCATVFADNIGHARQMVFAPNGVLYVNTWSGHISQRHAARRRISVAPGHDWCGPSRCRRSLRPGAEPAGGTGSISIGALYAETNDRIARYLLLVGIGCAERATEVVVSGLPSPAITRCTPSRSTCLVGYMSTLARQPMPVRSPIELQVSGHSAVYRARDPRASGATTPL
jgi:hypothetical protein